MPSQRNLRRRLLGAAAGAGILGALHPRAFAAPLGSTAALGFAELPDGALAEQELYALPGKLPLIKKTYRPPNFETPVAYFRAPITQGNAFFIRYHLAVIPEVNETEWKLAVRGDAVQSARTYTLAELRREFQPASVTAVCLCAGNRRGMFEPHVQGVQWGVGAMGNAAWTGIRLKDVLARAGVKADALEVSLDGADGPVLEKTPDFVKSIPVDVALSADTLIAFEMNGKPLPHLNGYPARLVVPGWTGTYWVKQLVAVTVNSYPETNYWMSTAYRLPRGLFRTQSFKSQVKEGNEPVTTMVVNSLMTSLANGQRIPRGEPIVVKGIAWDAGSGIAQVEVSFDGVRWQQAKLGQNLGRFSFREFFYTAPAQAAGSLVVMARATARSGETQSERLIHNPPGYHNNVVQRLHIDIG